MGALLSGLGSASVHGTGTESEKILWIMTWTVQGVGLIR